MKKYDGFAFLKCLNKVEWCIDQTIKKHAGNSPLNTIVSLSGGKGYHRKTGWPYATNNNSNYYNNNNNTNNNNNSNINGRNSESPQNNGGGNRSNKNKNNNNSNNTDKNDNDNNGNSDNATNENDGSCQSGGRTSKTNVEISQSFGKIAFDGGGVQCGGNCGNTVIRACHLVYPLLLNGKLDCKTFNEDEQADTIDDQAKMWNVLLNAFINHDDECGNNNEELLIDLMCFVNFMSQTVKAKNFDPFETETWRNKNNNNQDTVFETIDRLMKRMDDPPRKQRVLRCSRALIAEFRKYNLHSNNSDSKSQENENKNNKNNKNNKSNDDGKEVNDDDNYGLNQFLRGACFHQFILKAKETMTKGIESELQPMLVHVNSSVSLPTNENLEFNEKHTNVTVTNRISKAAQKEFTLQAMLRMLGRENGDMMATSADFEILKLIILTSKFVVEHQKSETFNLDVACIDGDKHSCLHVEKARDQTENFEMFQVCCCCLALFYEATGIFLFLFFFFFLLLWMSTQTCILFDIVWSKGVTLKFGQETKIKDKLMPLKSKLVKRMKEHDYLAFVEFSNKLEYFISNTFKNILAYASVDTMIELSRARGQMFNEKKQFICKRPVSMKKNIKTKKKTKKKNTKSVHVRFVSGQLFLFSFFSFFFFLFSVICFILFCFLFFVL